MYRQEEKMKSKNMPGKRWRKSCNPVYKDSIRNMGIAILGWNTEDDLSVFATTRRDGICITASDYKRLAPGEYFNDTLVEFSLKEASSLTVYFYHWLTPMPLDTGIKTPSGPRTHIFGTHFYSTLFHWYLAIIHRPGQILPPSGTENAAEQLDGVSVAHIYILDSLSGPHEQTRLELGQYLFNEALDKNTIVPTGVQSHNSLLGWFGTHIAGYDVPVPIQNNAIDCGVYLIHFAEIFLNDPEMVASSMLTSWFYGESNDLLWKKDQLKDRRALIKQKVDALMKNKLLYM
ncbi:hypothetical protein BS47DRAFT_1383302 [Hydnum rufescens UP504]|uniref:Ubiquitin-like protease family profile domain-containing protein n=1 Tax=Hydnum rufescens UP504 TaxID=1448309 RepID=A0A9P6AVK2_9AGAM|nr:hypothetical protein BS47DRAFT_1383302 [Hydnum rufescens UP504]